MKKTKIYLITALVFDPRNIDDPDVVHFHYSHTMGWFTTLKKAEKAVVGNEGDIHREYYDYCVIEEAYPGSPSRIDLEKWFKWEPGKHIQSKLISDPIKEKWLKWEPGRYLSIPKPKGLRNTTNVGIG